LLLYSSLGWNIYLATATGLVASVALGILVEFLFLRRFFRAPRLILTVATIGVTEVVVALGLLLPQWLGNSSVVQYPPFINLSFGVGRGLSATEFYGNDVLTLIVVPLVLLGLVAFFRFTSIGCRAARVGRECRPGIPARHSGTPAAERRMGSHRPARLHRDVLAHRRRRFSARAGARPDPPAQRAGGRGDRPDGATTAITFAAIGLGIVSQAARYHYSSDAYRSAIIAAIIVVALLAQRSTSLSRLTSAATSTWQETREVRPIPAELRREPAVRIARWVLGGLLVTGLALIPIILPGNRIELVTVIAIYGLIGLSLVVLTGLGRSDQPRPDGVSSVSVRRWPARWPPAGTSIPG